MTSGDLQQLGNTLRARRTAANLTVRQLADKAGLVASTVSRLETAQIDSPRPEHLQQLARALACDVEDFYALAGYLMPEGLPALRPYLRAKYGLGDAAAQRLEGYFRALQDQPNEEAGDDSAEERNRPQSAA